MLFMPRVLNGNMRLVYIEQFKLIIITFQIQIMESPFVNQAIPMVQVHQSTGKYQLTTQAINFLKAIEGPIAVVSVAGLYRTGKSYLLNRVLLNRSNGFGVGPTINPCTKGLWCWGSPIRGTSNDGQPVSIIVIDTEGIGAVDQDATHDTKIFTLAILTSSCFIYNSQGSIDESAIQNLSLIVNLTKHIQLKSSGHDEDGVDPDEVSMYFPSFYWVVRDFSLQLKDQNGNSITEKEYLDRALSPQNGFTEDIEEKNRIRRLLTSFFKDRDCFTMVRPLVNQEQLQSLDKLEFNQLRPEFVQQAMKFRKRILSSVKVKSLQNQKLNGDMYCSIINSYIKAINEGAVPNIESAWKYMCEQQCSKILRECQLFYQEGLLDALQREFPLPEATFNKIVTDIEERTLDAFRQKAIGENTAEALKELKKSIKKMEKDKRDDNIRESREELRNRILEKTKVITKRLSSNQYSSYNQFETEVTNTLEKMEGTKLHGYELMYMEASKKLLQQGAKFMFHNFTKKQESQRTNLKETIAKTEEQLRITIKKLEILERQKNDLSKNTDEMIMTLRHKIETLESSLLLNQKAKEEEEEKNMRQFCIKIQEQQKSQKNLEMKLKDTIEKLEAEKRYLSEEIKDWGTKYSVLELQCQQQLKILDDFSKKEKKMEIDLKTKDQDMTTKYRELAQKYESQKFQWDRKFREIEEKQNSTQEELEEQKAVHQLTKQAMESKERQLREEMGTMRKGRDEEKTNFQKEKSQLKNEIQILKNESGRSEGQLRNRLNEAEKMIKQMKEKHKKELSEQHTKIENAILEMNYVNQKAQTLKNANTGLNNEIQTLKKELQQNMINQGQEILAEKIQENTRRHQTQLKNKMEVFQKQRMELQAKMMSFTSQNRDLDEKLEIITKEKINMKFELEEEINRLKNEVEHRKERNREIEQEKERERLNYDSRQRKLITKYEEEIQMLKEKNERELQEISKKTGQTIENIQEACNIDKQSTQDLYKKKYDSLKKQNQENIENHEREIQQMRNQFEEQIQDLEAAKQNAEVILKNTCQSYGHEVETKDKHIRELKNVLEQIKKEWEVKESEFKRKEEEINANFKIEKQKLEDKNERLNAINRDFEKELMTSKQQNDLLKGSSEKKEARIRDLESNMQNEKNYFVETLEKEQHKFTTLETSSIQMKAQFTKDFALLKQQFEFSQDKIKDLENQKRQDQDLYTENMKRFKQEKTKEFAEAVEKVRTEKEALEVKYEKKKNQLKTREEENRKNLSSFLAEQQSLTIDKKNIENKHQEFEERKNEQISRMTKDLKKIKEDHYSLQLKYDQENAKNLTEIDTLRGENKDLQMKFEKEKSLLEQKLFYTEQSKIDAVKNHEQKIEKLNNEIARLIDTKTSERNRTDKNFQAFLHESQSENEKLKSDLAELRSTSIREKEIIRKELEGQIKEFRQKFDYERMQKEHSTKMLEKRINELSENEKRLKEDIDRLKIQKETREGEYHKKEAELKESYKEKINIAEAKSKEAERQKTDRLMEIAKEKVSNNMEKEIMKQQLGELQQKNRKLEKERDRYRSDAERMKVERRNRNGGHSALNTTSHLISRAPRADLEYSKGTQGRHRETKIEEQKVEENKENTFLQE